MLELPSSVPNWDGHLVGSDPEAVDAAAARLRAFLAAAAALTRKDLAALTGQQFRDLAFAIQSKRADWDSELGWRPKIRNIRRAAFWPSQAPNWPPVARRGS